MRSPDVLTVVALLFSALGIAAAIWTPAFLESVNDEGVLRWPMTLVAALLFVGASLARILCDGLVFRPIAAFLAVCSACMARPGIVELGGPYLPLEILLAPLTALLLALWAKLPTATDIRLAMGSGVAMVTFVYVLSFSLVGASTPRLDSLVFASMTVPILISGAAALRHRNRWRTR